MSIANEITKAQNNLKDCYDVCKSVDGVVLPEDKNFDNLPALIEQALNPFNKPSDWSDIRTDCPANSIALYAGHTPIQSWALGDRLDNKATFVGYFDSVNPDDNTTQRYAYFVVDAQYRSSSAVKDNTGGVLSADSPIPVYSTYTDITAATESATYNCTKLTPSTNFPPIDFAKAVSVNYNGNTYYGVIPNAAEILEIYNNRETLDTYDPTITDYSSLSLTEWASSEKSRIWTSTAGNASTGNGLTFWAKKKTGTGSNAWYLPSQINNPNFSAMACPIIEIPVDNSSIQYDNLGFTATCTGGYKVYIDETLYNTYASGAQCNITWSESGITTGDSITTPSALTAHKIWIEPATEGNNITAFHCARIAESGDEQQGILWAHFNLTNSINLYQGFGRYNYYKQPLMQACTAKNNTLKLSGIDSLFLRATSLTYVPVLDCQNISMTAYGVFYQTSAIKEVRFENTNFTTMQYLFYVSGIERVKGSLNTPNCTIFSGVFQSCYNLKSFPKLNFTSATNANLVLFDDTSLEDIVLDTSEGVNLTKIGTYATAPRFMGGLKGLRVSNQAPFNNATPPQINVSRTGLDRTALVQLFNDLPYNVGYEVVGSPTIESGVVSGFSADDYLDINNTFDLTKPFHIHIPVSSFSATGSTQYIFGLRGQKNSGLYFGNTATGMTFSYGSSYWASIATGLTVGTPLTVDMVGDGTDISISVTQSGSTWTSTKTIEELGYATGNSTVRFGKLYQAFTSGSIDLNNTYIKINGVYWFRGQPAMTKTLSCVGATGTADLTQDDKDIALTKGWSLTLS